MSKIIKSSYFFRSTAGNDRRLLITVIGWVWVELAINITHENDGRCAYVTDERVNWKNISLWDDKWLDEIICRQMVRTATADRFMAHIMDIKFRGTLMWATTSIKKVTQTRMNSIKGNESKQLLIRAFLINTERGNISQI